MIKKLNEFDSEGLFSSIVVKKTDHGYHTGIIHKNRDTKAVNILHLVFHEMVSNDDFSQLKSEYWNGDDFFAIPVNFEPELQIQLAAVCRRINELKKDSQFKYGFLFDGTTYLSDDSDDLELILGDKCAGLTCVTFVLVAFTKIGVSLIDIPNWQKREEDKDFHEQILAVLRKVCKDSDHIKRVEAEVGSPRVKPTEVTASLNFESKPSSFEEIVKKGKVVEAMIG